MPPGYEERQRNENPPLLLKICVLTPRWMNIGRATSKNQKTIFNFNPRCQNNHDPNV